MYKCYVFIYFLYFCRTKEFATYMAFRFYKICFSFIMCFLKKIIFWNKEIFKALFLVLTSSIIIFFGALSSIFLNVDFQLLLQNFNIWMASIPTAFVDYLLIKSKYDIVYILYVYVNLTEKSSNFQFEENSQFL